MSAASLGNYTRHVTKGTHVKPKITDHFTKFVHLLAESHPEISYSNTLKRGLRNVDFSKALKGSKSLS
jgi:methyltransferase-like protein